MYLGLSIAGGSKLWLGSQIQCLPKSFPGVNTVLRSTRETMKDPYCSSQASHFWDCCPSKPHNWRSAHGWLVVKTPGSCSRGLLQLPPVECEALFAGGGDFPHSSGLQYGDYWFHSIVTGGRGGGLPWVQAIRGAKGVPASHVSFAVLLVINYLAYLGRTQIKEVGRKKTKHVPSTHWCMRI